MVKANGEFLPLTQETAGQIHRPSEREFALHLLSLGCYLVYHEPHKVNNEEGTTLPDFLVYKQIGEDESGSVYDGGRYIEITIGEENDIANTRKGKQRRVMREEGIRYHVLFRGHLENIQKKNPRRNFFPHEATIYSYT